MARIRIAAGHTVFKSAINVVASDRWESCRRLAFPIAAPRPWRFTLRDARVRESWHRSLSVMRNARSDTPWTDGSRQKPLD
jgi:hypothetical protein